MAFSSVPIQTRNQYALKEWAVILKALTEGHQWLLFRKGGISEYKRGFRIEHQEFFIYPTFHHQQRLGVRSDYLKVWTDSFQDPSPPGCVRLSHYAQIQAEYRLSTLDSVKRLAPFHVLTHEELKKRFIGGQSPGLSVLLVRLYQLPRILVLPLLPRFLGCKSWIKLDRSYSTRNSRPVWDQQIFKEKRLQIESMLEGSGSIGKAM